MADSDNGFLAGTLFNNIIFCKFITNLIYW